MKAPTRRDVTAHSVYYTTSDSYNDLNLGALRQTVEAAEGMQDDARVTFERVHADYLRKDEFVARAIHIREEVAL